MSGATASSARAAVRKARRIVIKIGSSTLARDAGAYERLARSVRALSDAGKQVVIVSSGAIALGTKKLGYRARPKEMARLQAAGFSGKVAAVARYDDDVAELQRHGAHAVFHLYGSAGSALADHAADVLRGPEGSGPEREPGGAPGLVPG